MLFGAIGIMFPVRFRDSHGELEARCIKLPTMAEVLALLYQKFKKNSGIFVNLLPDQIAKLS